MNPVNAHIPSYDPERVYLLEVQDNDVVLGELVDHRRAEEQNLTQACVYAAVFNSSGQIFIQHRAAAKRLYPDAKTISVSGHVDPGETFEQAVRREAEEELGIHLQPHTMRKLGFFTGLSHCGPVYAATSDQIPRPDPVEVDAAKSRFVEVSELRQMLKEPDQFTPSGIASLNILLKEME